MITLNSQKEKIMYLFYENKMARYHLREIARKAKLNVNSATRFLNQLEKSRLLISEKDGNLKKYRIIKNDTLANVFTSFDIERLNKLNFNRKQGIDRFLESLDEKPVIAFLFGSTAKNTYTKENHESSFLYWASKNNIPVSVTGITDGSLGDILVFFKRNNPEFKIDSTGDNVKLTKLLMNEETAGCIILGGGISKHFLLNSAIFRDGFDYSIYLTTSSEFDGSDSGGNQEEAISWAKIKPKARKVKVVADATLTFPLLISSIEKV